MWPEIRTLCTGLTQGFYLIPLERKKTLTALAQYVASKKGQDVNLIFICTHNSRRSHFGQIWAKVAAEFYAVPNIHTFSGGTEATAFHENARKALIDLGFKISTKEQGSNPVYHVQYGEQNETTCFSKVYSHPQNPQQHFAAVLTCSDAEQNCPFIPGAEQRIATTYTDPKAFDGTAQASEKYRERCLQIATELLYTFSILR